jgi:PHD/YefM family antitoxin component YafN of YafNO toxin-antitoxin module
MSNIYVDSSILRSMTDQSMRKIPATLASRKGIGYLTREAEDHTVVLTSHGHSVGVLMSPAEYDQQVRVLREAAATLIETATSLVADRSDFQTVDQVRQRLASG